MANESNTNSYLTTRVMSASPQELRLMLIEGAVRFARMGRDGLAKRDFEQWYNGLTQCQAILLELSASLRPEIAPELCQQLNALYTFMYRRMLEASSERNAEVVDEVIGLLEYDRESWLLLMEKVEAEQAGDVARVEEIMRRAEARTDRADAVARGLTKQPDSPPDSHAPTTPDATPQHQPAQPPTRQPGPAVPRPTPPAQPQRMVGAGGVYRPGPGTYAPPVRGPGVNGAPNPVKNPFRNAARPNVGHATPAATPPNGVQSSQSQSGSNGPTHAGSSTQGEFAESIGGLSIQG